LDTTGEKEKRTSKKNVHGSTSSHDNKKFRTRSMEKQRGMAFGFRKTATVVKKKTGQIYIYIDVTSSPKRSDRLWSPLGLLFGSFPGVKRPGREG